jgi:hypothetical protein
MSKMKLEVIGRDTQTQYAVFDLKDPNVESLFDLIAKHDYYGIGEDMTKRIGDLQGFFSDSEEGSKEYRVFLSNNAQMVVFNALSEVLTQNASNMRMTHSRILRKRRDNKEDRTIGSNMRADVMYKGTSMICAMLSMLSMTIFNGEGITFKEVKE